MALTLMTTGNMRQRLGGAVGACVMLLATLGCDPVFKLSGSVKSSSGAPIRAVVRVVCDGYAFAETVTRQDGSFLLQRVGSCSEACKLEVLPEAGGVQQFPVMDYCDEPGEPRGQACQHVAASVRLPTEASSEQADSR